MVLVVDDDPDLREAIQEQLESEGYKVVSAGDGREALEQVHDHPDISLILVDLKMPTMDGRQLIAALEKEGKEIPIVVLSALVEPPRSGRGGRKNITGAVEVLDKPFSIEALLRIVAEHTSRPRG